MAKLKVASLFCGCGGTDVGMVGGFDFLGKHYGKNPVEIVYANDIEKSACDIFELNFGLKPDNRVIRTVKSDEISDDIDILCGGFPCQSFSIVAQNPKRLGIKDERGMLFFEICRILREKRPKCFIAENVKGLLSANKGEAFPLILDEFKKSGYNVSYKVLNAADYGVPQRRMRVIMVGIRDDLGITYKFPSPVRTEENYAVLREVIESTVHDKYFFSQKAVEGMERVRSKMNKGRAQDLDKPCNTVGSHLAKVSLNSTDPVMKDNGKYRRFTPREVARIQSFPDTFKLIGSEGAQYRALGNAIPPIMFWYVTRSLVDLLRNSNLIK